MSAWQPIETAPKDRTKVLIWAHGNVFAAWWDERFNPETDTNEDSDTFGMIVYSPAWTDGSVSDWGMEETCAYYPTHWQPLPAPPDKPVEPS